MDEQKNKKNLEELPGSIFENVFRSYSLVEGEHETPVFPINVYVILPKEDHSKDEYYLRQWNPVTQAGGGDSSTQPALLKNTPLSLEPIRIYPNTTVWTLHMLMLKGCLDLGLTNVFQPGVGSVFAFSQKAKGPIRQLVRTAQLWNRDGSSKLDDVTEKLWIQSESKRTRFYLNAMLQYSADENAAEIKRLVAGFIANPPTPAPHTTPTGDRKLEKPKIKKGSKRIYRF